MPIIRLPKIRYVKERAQMNEKTRKVQILKYVRYAYDHTTRRSNDHKHNSRRRVSQHGGSYSIVDQMDLLRIKEQEPLVNQASI
jgi:hypothetical protein